MLQESLSSIDPVRVEDVRREVAKPRGISRLGMFQTLWKSVSTSFKQFRIVIALEKKSLR